MTRFVCPASGAPSAEIDVYLAHDLRLPVRAVLAEASRKGEPTQTPNLPAEIEGRRRLFHLAVPPVEGDPRTFLLVIGEVGLRDTGALDETLSRREASDRGVLEGEVSSLRRRPAATLLEAETSSQEFKNSNEELQSMNEGLQSSNEELKTSREGLQSINEELETVNAELRESNTQLLRANSDLENLFESIDAAVLFLDPRLGVRSFTPATAGLFGIRDRDIGRPLTELSSRIHYPELAADAEEVGRTLASVAREVTVEATSQAFALRMRPYRTTDDRIEGLVPTFFEITERKRVERELETLYDTTPVGLSLHDWEHRSIRIDDRLAEIDGLPPKAHIGQRPSDPVPSVAGAVDEIVERVFQTGEGVLGIEIRSTTPAAPDTPRIRVCDYYPVKAGEEVFAVGTCIREVTGAKHMLADIGAAEARRRPLVGELQHRVKNTPTTVVAISRFLLEGADTPEAFQRRLAERLRAMARTHEALSEANWAKVSLHEPLRREAEPCRVEARVLDIEGPDVDLTLEQALNPGLALHETMTNAAKYGTLSEAGWHVSIRVGEARAGAGVPRHRLEWTEAGGPELRMPEGPGGFGTLLPGRILGPGLDGGVEMDPRPEGMRYVIVF